MFRGLIILIIDGPIWNNDTHTNCSHVHFSDYTADELLTIAKLEEQQYKLTVKVESVFLDYISCKETMFVNSRSVKNRWSLEYVKLTYFWD